MKVDGYLICILATTLFASVVTIIIPEGKTSALIKGIAKLVCLLSILSPIPNFFQGQPFFEWLFDEKTQNWGQEITQSVISTDEAFIHYFSQMRITVAQEELERQIEERFQIHYDVQFEYAYESAYGTLSVLAVWVFCEDSALSLQNAVRAMLNEMGYSEVYFAKNKT